MNRIRGYFVLMGLRHLLVGTMVYRSREQLNDAPALATMVDLMPLSWWCYLMFAVGFLALGGSIRPRENVMRFVVVPWSLALTSAVATCLLFSFAEDPQVTGILAVLFLVLVGKDFLMVGLPWTTPFERTNSSRLERLIEEA